MRWRGTYYRTDMLTAEHLHTLVHYDPETGVMTWLKKLSARQYVGDSVGSLKDNGYVWTKIYRKSYAVHRLVWLYMTGAWPTDEVEHVDRNRANNKWVNLENATHQENAGNRTPRHDSSSGVTGVLWSTKDQAWRATICIDGRKRQIAQSKSLIVAADARRAAEREHYPLSHSARGI